MELINNHTGVELPPIEYGSDTIKGAGILGSIDWSSFNDIGPMPLKISFNSDNPQKAALVAPGVKTIEIRWVIDVFDSNSVKTSTQYHKAFATIVPKKSESGKLEKGSTADGSNEFECLTYKKSVDGKVVLDIDKLANKFVVNGKDYMQDIRNAL
jgi:P2 family phage contractile tail tube protein